MVRSSARVVCAALVLGVVRATAEQPAPTSAASNLPLSDYIHTAWTQHDGMPLGTIGTILQTSDGYLWVIAADHGLLRFDGMRFVAPSTPCKTKVTSASSAPDGGLWALCGGQLIRRAPGGEFVEVLQKFLPPEPPPNQRWLVDPKGRPWFTQDSIRTFEPDGSGLRELPRPTRGRILATAADAGGSLWVSDAQQVVRVTDGEPERFSIPGVWCLTRARDDSMFAITPASIWRVRQGASPVQIDGVTIGPSFVAPRCIAEAADGALWFGTAQHGVARLLNGQLETLPDAEKTGRSIITAFVDREENVWVGGNSGLHRYRKPTVRAIPNQARYLSGHPAFVFVDSKDNLWLSLAPGGGVSRINLNTGEGTILLPRTQFVAIAEGADGRIWLSDTTRIGYLVNDAVVVVKDAGNAPIENVTSFKRDGRGQLWAVAYNFGVYKIDPGPVHLEIKVKDSTFDFAVSDRLGIFLGVGRHIERHVDGRIETFPDVPDGDDARPSTLTADGDSIWVASIAGLRRWRNGKWTTWGSEQGLPGVGAVADVTTDRLGFFWILSEGGFLRLPRAQLDETPDEAPRTLTYARLGIVDGVNASGGGSASSPHKGMDSRGRLYFPTKDSVMIVDPSTVESSTVPPPIVLESATFDYRPVDLKPAQSFVEPSLLEFSFTSLSLRSPELARFRYRLEGRDPAWIEAGTQRHVTYGALPPGAYTFRAIGASAEGVWNQEGASFSFQIKPVFWRTAWFRLSALALGVLVIGGLYQLRVRRLTRQFAIALDARVAERTRIARELHDTLLQTFQGALMHFQAATNMLPARPDDAKRTLNDVLDHAVRAVTEARDAVQDLRSPASAEDLAKTIGLLGHELSEESGDAAAPAIRVNVEGQASRLRPPARDNIVRITSEAVRNAVRHARAHNIQVDIHYSDRVFRVRIRDDGRGIERRRFEEQPAGHFGLPGMRERADLIGGTLDVRSRPGAGTEIDLVVPATKAYDSPARARRLWARKTTLGAGQ